MAKHLVLLCYEKTDQRYTEELLTWLTNLGIIKVQKFDKKLIQKAEVVIALVPINDLRATTLINNLKVANQNNKVVIGVSIPIAPTTNAEVIRPYTDYIAKGARFTEVTESLSRHLAQLFKIPPEILTNYRRLSAYQRELIESTSRPLNETKLIVVGEGSVGKTSIVNRIVGNKFNPDEVKTDGIAITNWSVESTINQDLIFINGEQINLPNINRDFKMSEDETMIAIGPNRVRIRVNIWDFGGQEIMHATHQFFLTKRSLYLLVLDARLTQEGNRVEYWLKTIQSFGGDSPVLIVGNKIDQHPLDIDHTGLKKKFPNIVDIVGVSAASGEGFSDLIIVIEQQVRNLPHLRDRLPETWIPVKTKLEALGHSNFYISQQEYVDLCKTNNIVDSDSQNILIGFLHDLGVVLHFQDDPRLEALGILNPQWVTNGVYKILNSNELFHNRGTLTIPILNKILDLPEYPKDKRLFIVDMMRKFEICYDIEPDKSFLIPDLLPKDDPFIGKWDDALAFQIHYDVLPSSIMSRFIVRMNTFIHKTVWRLGVVLKKGHNTALVKADIEDGKIFIWINGDENTRRDFLGMIRGELEAIHRTIAKIVTTEKVSHYQYPEILFDYQELLQFERDGIREFPKSIGDKTIIINVNQLLDGVADPSKRQQDLIQKHIHQYIRPPKTINPWKTGSFYLVSLIFGSTAYVIARFYGISGYDILASFGTGLTAMLAIGILQLKNDEKLEDASFIKLTIELIKRFPFFRRLKND